MNRSALLLHTVENLDMLPGVVLQLATVEFNLCFTSGKINKHTTDYITIQIVISANSLEPQIGYLHPLK